MTCSIDDCFRPATREGLCQTHYRQVLDGKRRRPVRHYARATRDAVEDAMFTFLDLRPTDDDGWRKARQKFWKSVQRYAESWARKRIKKWERLALKPPREKP